MHLISYTIIIIIMEQTSISAVSAGCLPSSSSSSCSLSDWPESPADRSGPRGRGLDCSKNNDSHIYVHDKFINMDLLINFNFLHYSILCIVIHGTMKKKICSTNLCDWHLTSIINLMHKFVTFEIYYIVLLMCSMKYIPVFWFSLPPYD